MRSDGGSSSTSSGDAAAAAAERHLEHHFNDLPHQTYAATLGMWIFLATEVLLFTGLFIGYSFYRYLFTDGFVRATHHLNLAIGTVNTFVLITSSLTVALAVWAARRSRGRLAALLLGVSVLLAITFLVLKGVEYREHFADGSLPGRYLTNPEMQFPGASIFLSIYFLATGLHAIHVTVGATVLAVVGLRAWRGDYDAEYHTPVELGGMYWHLVDVIWIFLYPLLYLL